MAVQKTYTMDDFKITRESTVKLIEHAGSDTRIVAAARTSTAEEIWEEIYDNAGGNPQCTKEEVEEAYKDRSGLINFLMKHRHGSPFEQSWLQFYIRAPIFVWREFHRHRIGFSYNEESARYKLLAPEFYLPPCDRPMYQNDNFKPGRPKFLRYLEVENGVEDYEDFCKRKEANFRTCYESYLQDYKRFDPGLARIDMNVGIFSTNIVACNPRSLMAFCSLRTHDLSAQFVSYPLWEIEQVARKMEAVLEAKFPITHKAFCDNRRVGP